MGAVKKMKLSGKIACFIIAAVCVNTVYYFFTDDLFSGKNNAISREPIINTATHEIFIMTNTTSGDKIIYDKKMKMQKKARKSKKPVKFFLNKIKFERWNELKLQLKTNLENTNIFYWFDGNFHKISNGNEKTYMLYNEGFFEIYSKKTNIYPYKYLGMTGLRNSLQEIVKFNNLRLIFSHYEANNCILFFTDDSGLYCYDFNTENLTKLSNFTSSNNSSQYIYRTNYGEFTKEFIISQSEKKLSVFDMKAKKLFEIDFNFIPAGVSELKASILDSGVFAFLYTDVDSNYEYHNFLFYDNTGKLIKNDFLKLEIPQAIKKKRYDLFDMINYSQIGMLPVLFFFNEWDKAPEHELYFNRIAGDYEFKFKYFGAALIAGFLLFYIMLLICKFFRIRIDLISAILIFILFPITGILIFFLNERITVVKTFQ